MQINVNGGTNAGWRKVQPAPKAWTCPDCNEDVKAHWSTCPHCNSPRPT